MKCQILYKKSKLKMLKVNWGSNCPSDNGDTFLIECSFVLSTFDSQTQN